jgi:hypothetical protein
MSIHLYKGERNTSHYRSIYEGRYFVKIWAIAPTNVPTIAPIFGRYVPTIAPILGKG